MSEMISSTTIVKLIPCARRLLSHSEAKVVRECRGKVGNTLQSRLSLRMSGQSVVEF